MAERTLPPGHPTARRARLGAAAAEAAGSGAPGGPGARAFARLVQDELGACRDGALGLAVLDLAQLGRVLFAGGRPDLALLVQEPVLPLVEARVGPGTREPTTLRRLDAALFDLARTLAALGQAGRAEGLFRRAVSLRAEALGEAHPEVADAWDALARFLVAHGQPREAGAAARQALALVDAHAGRHHPRRAVYLEAAAEAALLERDPARGEALAREGIGILRSAGLEAPLLCETLARCLTARGLTDAAEAARAEAQVARDRIAAARAGRPVR